MRTDRECIETAPASHHEATSMARISLSCGAFDALSAVGFARRFPPHFHDTFAIGVVESGGTKLRTQRGEWTARPGTILAFSPGEVHGAVPLEDTGYTYRMIYPSIDFMRTIGVRLADVELGAPLFRVPVIDDPTLGFELAGAHVPLMDGHSGPGAEAHLVAVVRKLVAKYGCDGTASVRRRLADVEVAERARLYLHARFSEQVRLAHLAELCGLSPFHLIRVFRRVVGVPPYAYLIQLRVNRAQTMLCRGVSVADVAYSCGFSDQSHLTRTFKKAIGVPPGQYVRSVGQAAA